MTFPSAFTLSDQPGQDGGLEVNDRVRKQAGALVVDLYVDVGASGEFLLAGDLSDDGAELVVGLYPVLRAVDVALQLRSRR